MYHPNRNGQVPNKRDSNQKCRIHSLEWQTGHKSDGGGIGSLPGDWPLRVTSLTRTQSCGDPDGLDHRDLRTLAWASEYPFKLRSSDAFSLYDLSRSQEGEYGIKTITREMAKTKMKPPACEAVWELKLAQRVQFNKVSMP